MGVAYLCFFVSECGANFTSKLEGMFKDMELSKEMMGSFREVSYEYFSLILTRLIMYSVLYHNNTCIIRLSLYRQDIRYLGTSN